jgi:hypothetical protein
MSGICCLTEKLLAFQEVLSCMEFVVTLMCVDCKHTDWSVSVVMLTEIMHVCMYVYVYIYIYIYE